MKQPKAMIVDSSIPCSELAKERLSEMGFCKENIFLINNTEEAIARANQELFDLIILESEQYIDGYSIAQHIKNQYTDQSPKIIGYINPYRRGKEHIYDGTLIKPIPEEKFKIKIYEVLSGEKIITN